MRAEVRVAAEPPSPLPAPPLSHFQTELWVHLLRRYGQTPHCVRVDDGEEALASWILYTTPADYLRPPRTRALRRLDVHLRATHGPVLAEGLSAEDRDAVAALLLGEARRLAEGGRALTTSLGLSPLVSDGEREAWRRAASEAGFATRPAHTYAATLPGDVDDAFAAIKRERRTKVRKAEKLGMEFEHSIELQALREYSDVRAETRSRTGLEPVPWEHFRDTWEVLEDTGVYHVFLARREGRVGAGQLAFVCNGYVCLSGVSVAAWAIAEKVPANDFLQWRVLRWAVESGQRVVDFAGAQPESEDPKIRSIDAFKSRWGTELHESLALELPSRRVRSRVARAAAAVLGDR